MQLRIFILHISLDYKFEQVISSTQSDLWTSLLNLIYQLVYLVYSSSLTFRKNNIPLVVWYNHIMVPKSLDMIIPHNHFSDIHKVFLINKILCII